MAAINGKTRYISIISRKQNRGLWTVYTVYDTKYLKPQCLFAQFLFQMDNESVNYVHSRQGLNYLECAFCPFIVILHVDYKYKLYIPGVTWMFWSLQKVDQSENNYFNLAGK